MKNKTFTPLNRINLAALLFQQRYILPISLLFYIQNGLEIKDLIFFQGIFYLTCLIAEIPAGYIGDIFSRKKILIFSYSLFLIRIFLWINFQGYFVVLLGEILYGLSKAFYRGVSDGYIYDYLNYYNISDKMLKNYGKFNFFISLGSATAAIFGILLYKFYNFKILLSIEFILILIAIMLLIPLPEIKHKKIKSKTFSLHAKALFSAFKNTLMNKNINYQIVYSGILFGLTGLFVWNFQHLMKESKVAIILFGVIYFINHIIRALASLFASRIKNKVPFKQLGITIWGTYFISIILIILNFKFHNPYFCFSSLVLICFAIGIYMIFNLSVTSLLHSTISSKIRATSSSHYAMFCELCSGLILISYKHLLETTQGINIFIVLAILFIFTLALPFKFSKENTL